MDVAFLEVAAAVRGCLDMLGTVGFRPATWGENKGEGGWQGSVVGLNLFYSCLYVYFHFFLCLYSIYFLCLHVFCVFIHLQGRQRVPAVRYPMQSRGIPLGLYTEGHGSE